MFFCLPLSLIQRLTQYERYKIIHKIRNNSKVTKEELIPALANIVPEGHIVSLDDPELVILVVVYKVRVDRACFLTRPTIGSDKSIAVHTHSLHACVPRPTFQGVAGLSVVTKYETLKRYNVTQLVNAKDLDGSGDVLSRIA